MRGKGIIQLKNMPNFAWISTKMKAIKMKITINALTQISRLQGEWHRLAQMPIILGFTLPTPSFYSKMTNELYSVQNKTF